MISYQRNRKSTRLVGHDYAEDGAYFMTICTIDRAYLFGEVDNGRMIPNDFGRLVKTAWTFITVQYDYVHSEAFVVMPNHIHGIWILGNVVENRKSMKCAAPLGPRSGKGDFMTG